MNYLDMIDSADPMSVLVAADWLEESGRTTEAKALRTLAPPLEVHSYSHFYFYGYGDGYEDGGGDDCGDGYGNSQGYSFGYGNGDVYGYNYGNGDGYGDGYGGIDINKIDSMNLRFLRIFLKSSPLGHPRGGP